MKALCAVLSLLLTATILGLMADHAHWSPRIATLQKEIGSLRSRNEVANRQMMDLENKLEETERNRNEIGLALNSNNASYEKELETTRLLVDHWRSNYIRVTDYQAKKALLADQAKRQAAEVRAAELHALAALAQRQRIENEKRSARALERLARAQEDTAFQIGQQNQEIQWQGSRIKSALEDQTSELQYQRLQNQILAPLRVSSY